MDKKIPFRRRTVRCTTDTRAYCFADPKLFFPWDELNEKARDEFDTNGPIPCEGGGVAVSWCADCRFGKVDEPELV